MKLSERIARGLFRICFAMGVLLGVVGAISGIDRGNVGVGLLGGLGFVVGGYVFGLVVAWIVRGFGKDD